jgi:hypothetical protein
VSVPAADAVRVSVEFDYQITPLVHPLPIQLLATTLLDEPSDAPGALVEIIINPLRVDELTTFAFPYVLLHECVCHVLQGPWHGERFQADANSSFAEGWMDVAALYVHREMVYEHPAPDRIDLLVVPRQAAQRDAADQVHRARHDDHPDDRTWSNRSMGQEAAEGMVSLFGRLPETKHDAIAQFLRLSFALNASPVNNIERDQFVTKVWGFTRPRLESRRHRLVAAVRQYIECRDVDRLVKNVILLVT